MRDVDHPNTKTDWPQSPLHTSRHRSGRTAAMEAAQSAESGADDIEKYLVHLAHLDMALPLKVELIRSLRVIMQSFVDRAFGDDPVQLAGNSGRNKRDTGAHADVLSSSPDTPTHHENLTSGFRRIAEPCEEKETGR
ncbi:MAG: hypothetical protein KDK08_28510 [Rhizobiaceae bacterium]|nr:hypothetical protein [Rhizobiaceae bacterium]